MKNIVAKEFRSHLTSHERIDALRQQVPDLQWSGSESEYDDLYVVGRTEDGIKVRIMHYTKLDELEVYFPRDYPVEDRKAFWDRVGAEILPALQATDVVDAL